MVTPSDAMREGNLARRFLKASRDASAYARRYGAEAARWWELGWDQGDRYERERDRLASAEDRQRRAIAAAALV